MDIINWLNSYFEKNLYDNINKRLKPIFLGMSGGIDSSLVCYLVGKSLKNFNHRLTCISMPSGMESNKSLESIEILKKWIINEQNLNIDFKTIFIGDIRNCIIDTLSDNNMLSFFTNVNEFEYDTYAKGNIANRTRMTILFYLRELTNGLVVNTTNKTEWSVGYFAKNGDAQSDISPIIHLYKRDVFKLAKDINMPIEIINRIPSAEAWEDQTDENDMNVSYEKLDNILYSIHNNIDCFESYDDIERVKSLILNSNHKRIFPGEHM